MFFTKTWIVHCFFLLIFGLGWNELVDVTISIGAQSLCDLQRSYSKVIIDKSFESKT
jgi:hypothetical protein